MDNSPRLLRHLAASLAVLATLVASAAGAQGAPRVMDAFYQEVLQGEGYTTLVTSPAGSLDEGSVQDHGVSMTRGTEYAFFAACDNDCSDVDLVVLDPDGQEMAADRAGDDSPTLRFRAEASGAHTIRVSMASCSVEPCQYWVRGYSKPRAGGSGSAASAARECSVAGAQLSISQGERISASLTNRDCVRSDASYARYYRLVLPARDSVTITMTSGDFDAYLVLQDERGSNLESDDDGEGGTDSRIDRMLDAGTYYVVANTLRSGTTGAFRLQVSARRGTTTTAGATGAGQACSISGTRLSIGLGESVSGSLSARDCKRGDDSYARYYRLVVPAREQVTITMTSDDFDTFLVLQDAEGDDVETDDDGEGGTDSRIDRVLAPGTYYVIANSLSSGSTGAYRLRVSARRAASSSGSSSTTAGAIRAGQPCSIADTRLSIAQGESVSGSLSTRDCKRGDDSYARYYRLDLPARDSVTITMTSGDFDTYLVLQDSEGSEVASNDDDEGEDETDSRIDRVLPAGTYYIIANSLFASGTGDFQLRVSPRRRRANMQ